MFGPNRQLNPTDSTSHRAEESLAVIENVRELLTERFDLQDYDLLFVPGSGSTGVEAVIESVRGQVILQGNMEGKFTQRWKQVSMAKASTKNTKKYDDLTMICQLETSLSEHQAIPANIVDAVSSFPYYPIPTGTQIFITSSNKMLGALPGLAIVGVHKDAWHLIRERQYFSMLNLWMYKDNPVPVTMPIHTFKALEDRLQAPDHFIKLGNDIKIICNMITGFFKPDDIIGDRECPVMTIKKSAIPDDIAKKYRLYGYNTDSEYYQIFTYSNDFKRYKEFIDDINSSKSK